MQTVPKQSRQSWGCGYEPAAPANIPVRTWDAQGRKRQRDEYDDKTGAPLINVCPGYLCSLPEVIDIARAHGHWIKNQLTTYLRGEASDAMLIAVEILDDSVNSCSNWEIQNPKGKG